jgi:hypothetical protein
MHPPVRPHRHASTMRVEVPAGAAGTARPGRVATATIVTSLVASAATHLDAMPTDIRAAGYLGVILAAAAAADLLLAAATLIGTSWSRPAVGLLAAADVLGFLATRTVGLPLAGELVGRWERPGGLITIGLDAALVAAVLSTGPSAHTPVEDARNARGTTR